jgi:hypothetical protein
MNDAVSNGFTRNKMGSTPSWVGPKMMNLSKKACICKVKTMMIHHVHFTHLRNQHGTPTKWCWKMMFPFKMAIFGGLKFK